MTNILLIEDDVELAIVLRRMIELFGYDFHVTDTIGSTAQAKQWLSANKPPHLIICDIELSDGSSIGMFEELGVICPVIYCTGHNEYALQAFENNGIDYLLKPVGLTELHKSLERFRQFRSLLNDGHVPAVEQMPKAQLSRQGFRSSLLAYVKDQIIPIKLADIDFIYYNNYQVVVYTAGASYETRDTLNNILETLNPRDFFRANRQFIVSRRAVVNIQQYFGRKLLVGMSCATPEPVVVSKANATEFLRWVEGLHVEQLHS